MKHISLFMLVAVLMSVGCVGVQTQEVEIPPLDGEAWHRIQMKRVPCSLEVPLPPSGHSYVGGWSTFPPVDILTFFPIYPPPGILDDAVPLMTVTVDLYPPQQFAEVTESLKRGGMYRNASPESQIRMLRFWGENKETTTYPDPEYSYVRRDLRTADGSILSCSIELRDEKLIPHAKRIANSIILTEQKQ